MMPWDQVVDLIAKVPEEILKFIFKVGPPWVMLASFITKFTPSESDNKIVDKIMHVLHTTALNPSAAKARKDTGFKNMVAKNGEIKN